MDELEKEKRKLSKTVKEVKEVLSDTEEELDDLYGRNLYDVDTLRIMAKEKEVSIRNLKSSVKKPYFARIDFNQEGENKTQKIYIGKNGVKNLQMK
ncbi:MAG: hypothetical protein IJF92_03830 [Bacilli bacterium]|nr:hypothetical protein [Bacilli bacterium]